MNNMVIRICNCSPLCFFFFIADKTKMKEILKEKYTTFHQIIDITEEIRLSFLKVRNPTPEKELFIS